MIVLDTHALVWWAGSDSRLSRKASTAIRAALKNGEVGLPMISVWEIGMLIAKGRLALNMSADDWMSAVQSIPNVQLLPLTTGIALDSTRLPGSFHGDPADRMIVATARAANAPLVTADRKIRAYRHVQTVW